jgi:hypothetical protein
MPVVGPPIERNTELLMTIKQSAWLASSAVAIAALAGIAGQAPA